MKQPFHYYFILRSVTVIMIAAFSFSCNKKTTPPDMRGEWQEIHVPGSGSGDCGQTYYFKFDCESRFRLEIRSFTNDHNPDDSCSQPQWIEYAAGTFRQDDSKLVLNGAYTNQDFIPLTSGCHNVGNLNKEFMVNTSQQYVVLQLLTQDPASDFCHEPNQEFILERTKSISCN